MKLKIFTLAIATVMSFASLCRAQILYDNFASDSRLNSSLWATQSSILSALAPASSSPGSTLLTPTLGFSSAGMQMSGVNGDFQFSGFVARGVYTTFHAKYNSDGHPLVRKRVCSLSGEQ